MPHFGLNSTMLRMKIISSYFRLDSYPLTILFVMSPCLCLKCELIVFTPNSPPPHSHPNGFSRPIKFIILKKSLYFKESVREK